MFGKRNESEIAAARKDFECYTLMGVPTLVGKLAYLDELRADINHRYRHWGLERQFGTDHVEAALGAVHSLLAREFLSTRLRSLAEDAEALAKREDLAERQRLVVDRVLHAPDGMSAAEEAHFALTVETLKLLRESRCRSA
jgi:hypothetical protein